VLHTNPTQMITCRHTNFTCQITKIEVYDSF